MDEMTAIWGPSGVRLTSGLFADRVPPGSAVVSVRLVGETGRKDGRAVLGWVVAGVHDQEVPIVFISEPGVRTLLAPLLFRGRPLNQMPSALRDRRIGQAIGRIIAHELGHYLLRSSQHARVGLMQPSYSSLDLLAETRAPFRLHAGDWGTARREVARLAEAQTR